MTKLRVTLTVVSEYEVSPDDYRDCSTPEEMAEYDRKSYLEAPGDIVEEAEENEITVKVEVIEG